MKLEQIKKLKEELKETTFSSSYAGFSKLAYILSILSNFFSIIFAYFYMNTVILTSFGEVTPTVENISLVVSLVILAMLELIKRFVFDKFTLGLIREKYSFKGMETKILLIISILLIFASFRLSTSGAESWSNRKDEITNKVDNEISNFNDSLSKKYDANITYLDSLNKELLVTKQTYEKQLDEALDKKEKIDISKKLRKKEKEIASNELKIKEIKAEKDKELLKFEGKKKEVANKNIETNSKNPHLYFLFSSIIEGLILFGIFFLNYYKTRTIQEYDLLISSNPNYKKFNLYNEFIDMIYKSDTKIGDILPFKTEIVKLLKSNNINVDSKELDDLFRVFSHLGILKQKGNRKVIIISELDAKEVIKTHLKID